MSLREFEFNSIYYTNKENERGYHQFKYLSNAMVNTKTYMYDIGSTFLMVQNLYPKMTFGCIDIHEIEYHDIDLTFYNIFTGHHNQGCAVLYTHPQTHIFTQDELLDCIDSILEENITIYDNYFNKLDIHSQSDMNLFLHGEADFIIPQKERRFVEFGLKLQDYFFWNKLAPNIIQHPHSQEEYEKCCDILNLYQKQIQSALEEFDINEYIDWLQPNEHQIGELKTLFI